MSQQSTGFGKDDKRLLRSRATGATTITTSLEQLLYTRQQTRQLLGGISVATLQRLEAQGLLRPKRLDSSKTKIGQVFYTRQNLLELVGASDA
jgi:hypothetical protein